MLIPTETFQLTQLQKKLSRFRAVLTKTMPKVLLKILIIITKTH